MRISVNREACCSARLCALIAPEVFDQDEEDVVVLLDPQPPAELHDAVREASDGCPSAAIHVAE